MDRPFRCLRDALLRHNKKRLRRPERACDSGGDADGDDRDDDDDDGGGVGDDGDGDDGGDDDDDDDLWQAVSEAFDAVRDGLLAGLRPGGRGRAVDTADWLVNELLANADVVFSTLSVVRACV